MISFKSRSEIIRNSDIITRNVNTVYPHINVSRLNDRIGKQLQFLDLNSVYNRRFSNLELKYADKINELRLDVSYGIELLKNVIDMLKNGRTANCYESARLAEIIAKINGLKNIYPMKMFISRNQSGALMPLDHVVAVLTRSKIEPNKKYEFKNKEAVILDPWLGVTEFCGRYLEKLKHDYANLFILMPDNEFSLKCIAKTSKNLNEFKQKRIEKCFNPTIKFLLHEDRVVTPDEAEKLKNEFPELIINDYKNIEL